MANISYKTNLRTGEGNGTTTGESSGFWLDPVQGLVQYPQNVVFEGIRYLVAGVDATGVFAGKENHIAQLVDGLWVFQEPQEGFHTTVLGEADTIYVYTGSEWREEVGGGAFIEEDVKATVEIGGVKLSDVIPEGTSLTEFVKKLFSKDYVPAIQDPSFSLAHNTGLREINEVISFQLTYNFNRGAILGKVVNGDWNGGALQAPRAGAASSYKFIGVTKVGEQYFDSIRTSNSLLVENYRVVKGENHFGAEVTHLAGVQPTDSKGADFGAPYPAGTVYRATTFEGVYPIYGATQLINVSTKQPLYSMISGNNIELLLAAESGGNKQFFDIPKAWLSNRPLGSITIFNTVSNSYDPTNTKGSYAVSDVVHSVQGVDIAYNRFTSTAPDRGEIKIKLTF